MCSVGSSNQSYFEWNHRTKEWRWDTRMARKGENTQVKGLQSGGLEGSLPCPNPLFYDLQCFLMGVCYC